MSGWADREPKRNRLCRRTGLWVAAVALAAVAAMGCSSNSSSPGTATTATTATTAASPTTATTSASPTPKATTAPSCTKPCADASGWIAEISDFKFDVNSGNEFETPEAGNVFVTVQVTFVNKSSSTQSADSFEFKLKSAGVERDAEFAGPCESWSSVDVTAGASYGPKCLAFQAASGKSAGLTVIWTPGLIKTYDIPIS